MFFLFLSILFLVFKGMRFFFVLISLELLFLELLFSMSFFFCYYVLFMIIIFGIISSLMGLSILILLSYYCGNDFCYI